jgi:hypothetical protein
MALSLAQLVECFLAGTRSCGETSPIKMGLFIFVAHVS